VADELYVTAERIGLGDPAQEVEGDDGAEALEHPFGNGVGGVGGQARIPHAGHLGVLL
jgi:hypothetical protein